MLLSPSEINRIVKSESDNLAFNEQILEIYDGNICKFIENDLKKQLSPQSFTQAMHRIAPINILPKVIDKLTNIYQTSVTRELQGDPSQSDRDLFDRYKSLMHPNAKLNVANEMLNMFRSTLIYPNVINGVPTLSVIENDKFAVNSSDPLNPSEPTEVILLAGKEGDKFIYWNWDANNFWVTDSEEKLRPDIMERFGNPDGINPIGRLPFIYVKESDRWLKPKPDLDMFKILKLVPIMLSDLNLAAMFQCFSILYTIDADQSNIVFAPNALWDFKSQPQSDNKPQVGSIKPNVDYDQVLKLIQSILSMWLGTKGIKASSIGGLDSENFASGVSKMLDEMDTFEARQAQTTIFKQAEKELWDLVLNYMHPYWQASGKVSIQGKMSTDSYVNTTFAIQLPQQTRGQIVRDVKEERSAGFITRKRALKKLNPEFTQEEIEALENELDEEFGEPARIDEVI